MSIFALRLVDITSVLRYHVAVMSRKDRKRKPKGTMKAGRFERLRGNAIFWTVIGLIISIGFNVYFTAIQLPQLRELERIKQDFPMVQNIYEAIEISKAIPWPEPLEPTKNLDYFPAVLLKAGPIGDFETMPYGYVLRLVTGNNTYLATDSPEQSTEKTVVFSIAELREKRKKLTWFLYEGPFPPEGWTSFE